MPPLKFFKILFLLLFIVSPKSSQAKILEKIKAVVNGEIITLTEIKEYKKKLKNGGFFG